ncbi:YdcF family protein [Aerococcaceae bacterium WGS1372]
MLLYWTAFVLVALFFLSFIYYHPLLQPSALLLYGLTSLLIGIVRMSDWVPIFIFRYFLYIISGFFIAAVPFLLLLVAILPIHQAVSQPSPRIIRTVYSVVTAFILFTFVGATLWGVFRLSNFQIQEIIGVYVSLSIYFVGTFLCYIILNLVISFWSRYKKSTILIVLGSQLDDVDNVTGVLRKRLDKAIQVYNHQKTKTQSKISIIVTGGPRSRSSYSEAEGMENYLIQKGVPAKDIILETQAKNTYENLEYSQKLISKYRLQGKVMIITSRFHLMRTTFIAHQQKFKAYYRGAGSPALLWPFSIIREYIAFLHLTREINFAIIVIIIGQGLLQILI